MCIHRRDFDKTICMYFLIKNESFFDKYNEIWEKVGHSINKLIENLYAVKNIYILTKKERKFLFYL